MGVSNILRHVIEFVAVTSIAFVSPVVAQTATVYPMSPIAPTDSNQCSALSSAFRDVSERISRAHDQCLNNSSSNSEAGGTCSNSSCQSLHDQRAEVNQRSGAAVSECQNAVSAYLRESRIHAAQRQANSAKEQSFRADLAAKEAQRRVSSIRSTNQQAKAATNAIEIAKNARAKYDQAMTAVTAAKQTLAILTGSSAIVPSTFGAERTTQSSADAVVDYIGERVADKLGLGPAAGQANPMLDIAQRVSDNAYSGVRTNEIAKSVGQTTTNGSIRIMGVAIRAFEQAEARWNASAKILSGGVSVPSQWTFTALGFDPATGAIVTNFVGGSVQPRKTYELVAPQPATSVSVASAPLRTQVRKEMPFEEYRRQEDARRTQRQKRLNDFDAETQREERAEARKQEEREAFQMAIIDAQIRSSAASAGGKAGSRSSTPSTSGKYRELGTNAGVKRK